MTAHVFDTVTREDMQLHNDEEVRRLAREHELPSHFDPYRFVPPGPVAQAFILSDALTDVIMGPLGGGKTTACAFKRIYTAALGPIAWHPEDRRPTRMCRGIVLRDTFRSVEKTVLESWRQWFPKGYPGSSWAGGNDRPVTHILRFRGQDGVRIEAVTEFAGLSEQNVGDLMKGREYSFGWLNEVDTHAAGALNDMEQRVGRYPMADLILRPEEIAQLERQLGHRLNPGKRQRKVIGDMNAPTIDNWTYPALITDRKPDRAFFQQPSGRSADAENRGNLDPDYYGRIIRNQDEHYVRRMVDNKFGYSRAGKPVYPSFDPLRNVAGEPIAFVPQLDLHIGIDGSTSGLSPAATFGQAHATGRIAVLDELYMGHGVGATRFAEGLKLKLAGNFFGGAARVHLWFDPAAQYGADTEAGELAFMDTVARALGLPALIPGNGSNEIGMRLDAVRREIRGYTGENTHLLVSPSCTLVIAGRMGKYRYKKKPESATNDFEDLPEKSHPDSDIQDSLQYLTIGVRGRRAMEDADDARPKAGGWRSQANGPSVSRSGFDVHKVGR